MSTGTYAGTCYVETKSLDGETNLKPRSQMRSLLGCVRDVKDVPKVRGTLTTTHPNKKIDGMTGNIVFSGGVCVLPVSVSWHDVAYVSACMLSYSCNCRASTA